MYLVGNDSSVTAFILHMYNNICIPVCGRFKGFDWGITTRLVVIPQWYTLRSGSYTPVVGNYTPVVSSYTPVRKNSKLYNQLLKNVLTQL